MDNNQKIKDKIKSLITIIKESKEFRTHNHEYDLDEILQYLNKSEWISVKDRLPKYKECILIYTESQHIVDGVYLGEYGDGLHYFRVELLAENALCTIDEDITHWMPLPIAPKA